MGSLYIRTSREMLITKQKVNTQETRAEQASYVLSCTFMFYCLPVQKYKQYNSGSVASKMSPVN